MNEITGHVDMGEFAEKMGMTSSQVMVRMQELAQEGFLKKVGHGFALTEKGKNILKADVDVPSEKRFSFYLDVDQPAGVAAGRIDEFYEASSKVDASSLEFHSGRGDLENWFRTTVGDAKLADELAKFRKAELQGEELRTAIAKALKTRYSL